MAHDWVEFNRKYQEYNQAFGTPCLVHATKQNHLPSIINHEKLKIASERGIEVKGLGLSFLDKVADVHDSLFFSPGFQYNTQKDKPLDAAIIFDMDILDSSWIIYKLNGVLLLAKEFVRFLTVNHPETIEYLRSLGTGQYLDMFYETEKDPTHHDRGIQAGALHYWKFTKELEQTWELLQKNSPSIARQVIKHLHSIEKKNRVTFFRKRYLLSAFHDPNRRRHEVVCKKSIRLDNSHLLGFYVEHPTEEFIKLVRDFKSQSKHVKQLVIFDGKRKIVV